ncbi:MAG TPA: type II toxin-antitoxin system HicB family antitoxin [Actinomycetota bacterium]|nr:type II toxin-antitoxin system HicB family antitoxin [Actinomycetota bacterium]
MSKYLVIIEEAGDNYSAYSPDVPGCVAAGDTRDEAVDLMREAITTHFEGLREEGLPIPAPTTSAEYLAVAI